MQKRANAAVEKGQPPIDWEEQVRAATAMLGLRSYVVRVMSVKSEEESYVVKKDEIWKAAPTCTFTKQGPLNFIVWRCPHANKESEFFQLIKSFLGELKAVDTFNADTV